MSGLRLDLRGAALTLAAIALGYGLWVWSSKVEDWIGIPELLPIIRLVVIIAGLTVAEMAYQRAAQFIAQKN